VSCSVGTPVGTFDGAGDGAGDGTDVGTNVGTDVGTSGSAANGAGVQYVGAPVVGVEDGRGVGFDVGTLVSVVGAAVSSSRRAPSRRPLDRRAFGPLLGGRCPPTTALRNKHRQAIIMNDGSPLLHDLG